MSAHADLLTNPLVVAHLRSKVKRLVGSYGFTADDEEDLRQELFCSLWEGLPNFRPSLASGRTFAWRLIRNRICRLIEHQTAQRRFHNLCKNSLNDLIECDDGAVIERGDLISADEVARGGGRHSTELLNLRIDLSRVVSALPSELRNVVDRVGEGDMSNIARALSVSRPTLYRRLALLRMIFADAGLAGYVSSADWGDRRRIKASTGIRYQLTRATVQTRTSVAPVIRREAQRSNR